MDARTGGGFYFPEGLPLLRRRLCLQDIRARRSPTARSICGCALPAERLDWEMSRPTGWRHSAATILLNHMGKDLREIQELLRYKNIRTTVRYPHVGYEQTRQTAEALSRLWSEALGR